jgi:outer membrane protein OmpA-like peptidoglycan-associated protein
MKTSLLLAVLLAAPVFADAIDVSYSPTAVKGTALPTVNVHILEPIAGFRLKLFRHDGKKVDVKGGGAPGTVRHLELEQDVGVAAWKGELVVNHTNGTESSMALEFETTLYVPLFLKMDKATDVDIHERRLAFTLTNPAGKAHLKVIMDTGTPAFDGEIPFSGQPAGTKLEVTWPKVEGEVMKIELKAFDTGGFFTGVELTPWHIDIPHEEVNFDTGKWDVKASEQPKLDKSFQQISEAVAKYGHLADIRLYIAGHTDTVAAKEANRKLSYNRAQAIALYFRKKGLKLPLYVEGFGEEALLVDTPDETDEPRNRRAEYILSIDDPGMKNSRVVPRWKRL